MTDFKICPECKRRFIGEGTFCHGETCGQNRTITKLVRDRIPQIIYQRYADQGLSQHDIEATMHKEVAFLIEPNEDMIIEMLRRKLTEEVDEFLRTTKQGDKPEELADIIEVCFALADRCSSIGREDLLSMVKHKRNAHGGFDAGIVGTFKEKK